jgi:hypothetical protein
VKDQRWQLRRCEGCGHEERFPALMPTIAVCGACRRRTEHARLCLCGCGERLVIGRRRDVVYAGPSHKTRAWKARTAYDARRAAERAREASPVEA